MQQSDSTHHLASGTTQPCIPPWKCQPPEGMVCQNLGIPVLQNSPHFPCLGWQLYQTHLDFISKYIIEWPSNGSESLDEVPVIAGESAEHADLCEGSWHGDDVQDTQSLIGKMNT